MRQDAAAENERPDEIRFDDRAERRRQGVGGLGNDTTGDLVVPRLGGEHERREAGELHRSEPIHGVDELLEGIRSAAVPDPLG